MWIHRCLVLTQQMFSVRVYSNEVWGMERGSGLNSPLCFPLPPGLITNRKGRCKNQQLNVDQSIMFILIDGFNIINGFLWINGWERFPGNHVGEWGTEACWSMLLPLNLDFWDSLCPLTEQLPRTSSWPHPPRKKWKEGRRSTSPAGNWKWEGAYRPLNGQQAQEGHRLGTWGLGHIILSSSKVGPRNARHLLTIWAVSSPAGEGQQVSLLQAPLPGREQQITSSLETWTGMINVLEHLSYVQSITENQK